MVSGSVDHTARVGEIDDEKFLAAVRSMRFKMTDSTLSKQESDTAGGGVFRKASARLRTIRARSS